MTPREKHQKLTDLIRSINSICEESMTLSSGIYDSRITCDLINIKQTALMLNDHLNDKISKL